MDATKLLGLEELERGPRRFSRVGAQPLQLLNAGHEDDILAVALRLIEQQVPRPRERCGRALAEFLRHAVRGLTIATSPVDVRIKHFMEKLALSRVKLHRPNAGRARSLEVEHPRVHGLEKSQPAHRPVTVATSFGTMVKITTVC
jgi:hypothetical protein